MHFPVMRTEVLQYLAPRADGVYLDATAGMFGHASAVADRLTTGRVIACDRDAESLEIGFRNATQWADRIRPEHAKFSELRAVLDKLGIDKADGLLADLGPSLEHFTRADRGFSLMLDGPVDMRLDRSQNQTAAEIVNITSEKTLADLIYELGQERSARKIARFIVRARPIQSTLHLARVVEQAAPRTGPLHPATRTFMALRIATNQELEELDSLLEQVPKLVASNGRAVFITFMSLEDRKVKRSFQSLAREGRGKILTKHVIRPTGEEIRMNAPSRSAKLRALQLL